jgi:hypothetical protein
MSIPRTLTVLAHDIPYEGRVACEFCRFWEAIPPGRLDGSDGICRRMPPVPAAIMCDDGDWYSATQWPGTNRDTWCGEFLPVVTASPDPPPITTDPGRGARARVNAVEGEVPTE